MFRPKVLIGAVVILFAPWGISGQNTKLTPSIPWMGSWNEAFARAKEENRPILIAMNAEGLVLQGDEGNANDEMAKNTYHDEKLVEVTRQSINLISSSASHNRVAVKTANGKYRQECSQFPGVTCEEHQEIEKKVRETYFKNVTDIVVPQHLLVQPNGMVIDRREYQVSSKQLVKLIQDATKLVGKPRKQGVSAPLPATKNPQVKAEKKQG